MCYFDIGAECLIRGPGAFFHPRQRDGLATVTVMLMRLDVTFRIPERIQYPDEGRSLAGEVVDIERHEPAVEVKGATYSLLEVAQTDGGDWIAQCVVDV